MFIQRVRVRFQKRGELRAVSHLDLMRAFERALRRTGLQLRMSEGFNPRPRISFPVPLGVGIEGLDEVLEFDLAEWTPPAEIERRLKEQLPGGLEFVSLELTRAGNTARAEEVTYRITPDAALAAARTDARLEPEALAQLMARDEIPVRRIRKGRKKVVNIRPFLLSLERDGEAIILRVKAGPQGSSRPEEVLGAIGFDAETCRSRFRMVRTRVQLAN